MADEERTVIVRMEIVKRIGNESEPFDLRAHERIIDATFEVAHVTVKIERKVN